MKNDLGLIVKNGNIVVSSRDVAFNYGKRHADVMRDIRNISEMVPETNERNFALVDYSDAKGEERPMYLMDRQGFAMLVTGFTGKKAKEFTYKYTLAFEEMAKEIEQPKKLSAMEQLRLQYEVIEEHEEKLTVINGRVETLENNMNIDYGQQKILGDIARKKAVQALGGMDTPSYKDKGVRTKVFSRVWKDFKDYFGINSFKNTPRKDFDKAKEHLESWQVQGKLLKEIEDCNNQIAFDEIAVAKNES